MKKDPIQLQQRLIYYRAELDKYKKRVQDYQENYHYSQLEKLKIENAALREELEQWNNQEAAVKGELSKRIQGFEEQVARYEDQEEKFKNELQEWQKQSTELKTQKRDLLYKVQELEGSLGETRRRLSQSQKDMNLLQVSYIQVQKELQEEKVAKIEADKQIISLRKALADEKKDQEEKQKEFDCTISQSQKNMNLLQVSYTQAQKEFQKEKTAKLEKDKQIVSLRKVLADEKREQEEKQKEFNHSISQVQEKNEFLLAEMNTQTAALAQIEQEREEQTVEIDQLQMEKFKLAKRENQLQEEIKQQQASFDKDCKKYDSEIDRLKGEKEQLTSENKQLSEKINNQQSTWEKQAEEYRQKLNQFQAENEQLKTENVRLKEQYKDQKEALEEEKVEEAALLSDMEKQMQFLLGGANGERRTFDGKVAIVKALEQKLEELVVDINELEDSVDEED